ncbi:hypothetical protein DFH07DRAFT_957173 [Mycena maculata]|uniref:Methyltransferase domain-containing protein n=1 Tax=Mycena maculata TaxID=230809 RepID=A0AAD7JCL0_9AGAR|nr:hypothetical protein DFH07DRAFT_957173 [Mycena maculata]
MKRPATSPGPSAAGPSTPTLQKRHSTSFMPQPHETTTAAPPRPPRNPARAAEGIETIKPKKKNRPSTATGAREDVTPWEFFPVNTPTEMLPTLTADESAERASATATGKREDVLPWELFPAPQYDDLDATNTGTEPVINGQAPASNHSHIRQPRASTSTSMLSFHDTLLRRRKSTGTKAPPSANRASLQQSQSPRTSTSTAANKSPGASPKVLHKIPSTATVRPPLPKSSSTPIATVSSMSIQTITPSSPASTPTPSSATSTSTFPPQNHGHGTALDPKFSTADRTILQELRRNISARAAQFVVKGGPSERGRLVTSGARHHAYAREEVPYPRSYAREVLDLDVWETMACQKICDSLTWHVFPTPPTKVLDIGCGTGTWILNCGMAWRNCHFVGMDIVPLHPDLGASELSTRITWVQANFLEGLPFEADEFDFVHIKRIALGVPEDKWDGLFEEIARVLKPGGAFELIEEDLFFPGMTSDEESDSDSDLSELRYARRDSVTTDGGEHEDDGESVITGTGSGGSRVSYDGTPNTSLGAIPATPPRTASPLPIIPPMLREEVIEEAAEEGAGRAQPEAKKERSHAPSHRHSFQARALVPASPRAYSGSTSSLLGLGPAVNPPPIAMAERRMKPRGYSASTLISPPGQHPSVLSFQSASPSQAGTGTAKPPFAPFLLRTLPKAPPNPRDHSLLEGIYIEMNATRFINLAPLSLLANMVGLHFKDVRTHPPLQLTFPPPVAKVPGEDLFDVDDDTDSDDARNAIIPSPRRRHSTKAPSVLSTVPNSTRSTTFGDDSTLADEPRFVNTSDLLKRESRYISLDDARMSAFSPSNRSSFPAMSPLRSISGLPGVEPPVALASSAGVDGHPAAASAKPPVRIEQKNRLPNGTFNIDVRSLNMHLALRTAEILACAESMWEWVVSYQARAQAERAAGRPRAGSLASELSPRASRLPLPLPDPTTDAFKSAVLDLTREDFDGLLVKFELDMRDNMAIGSTLRDQFGWACMPIAPSQDRKAFLTSCERWEQWQDQRGQKVKHPYERHQARKSIDTPYQNGHEALKPEVIRGRSSLPESSSRHRGTSSSIPPDRRLSRSIRVFAAWKP